MELPTIEQAQEFLRVINVGREAIDLEPLEKLEFARCEPAAPFTCLSATNLFADADLFTGEFHAMSPLYGEATLSHNALAVARAYGKPIEQLGYPHNRLGFEIPEAIRVVTDPFDTEVDGLEDRLREAGVIA